MRTCLLLLLAVEAVWGQIGLSSGGNLPANMPQITRLDVQCEKSGMTIDVEFNVPFNGVIYSKGFFSDPNCRYVAFNSRRNSYQFILPMSSCGTVQFNDGGAPVLQNTIIFQNDESVQEVWDTARTITCEWQDTNIQKVITWSPLSVGMLDSTEVRITADESVDCRMDIQLGRYPQSSAITTIVRIGEDISLLIYATDPDSRLDMNVQDCYASSSPSGNTGSRLQLTNERGCVVKDKLIEPFVTTRRNDELVSYAIVSAFKFPDFMEVFITCNVEICKGTCPNKCDTGGSSNIETVVSPPESHSYSVSRSVSDAGISSFLERARSQRERINTRSRNVPIFRPKRTTDDSTERGLAQLGRALRVIAPEDVNSLFNGTHFVPVINERENNSLCMPITAFSVGLVILVGLLFVGAFTVFVLAIKLRSYKTKETAKD